MKVTDKITITNEDCMELLKRTPDNFYDLAICDPPYGIGEDKTKRPSRGKTYTKPHTSKDWDSEIPNDEYFKELFRISKNQIIWGGNYFIEKINKNSSCWLVWNKKTAGNNADCELAWSSFKTAVRRFDFMWEGFWQENMKDKEKRIHPTQKPVQLYKWILKNYAQYGFKILDTHLGSGSHAIAIEEMNSFEKMNLTLTACELDKEYYDKAIQRIQNHVSQQKLF